MSNVQKQDLVIFSDNSVISNELCAGKSHDLITITSSPATSSFWLLTTLVETRVTGAPFSLNSTSVPVATHKNLNPITIASFIHNAQYYTDALNKLKLGPESYKFIDLLTNFVIKNIGKPRAKVLSELLETFPQDSTSLVILEQPEVLLTLLDGLTSDELHKKFIMPLMQRCGLLIISTNINYSPNGQTKDAIEFSRFVAGCFYKSIVVLSLKPLDTGRAADVTGSFRITRGGASNSHLSCHVVENEYLYLNQKENTKLFYR